MENTGNVKATAQFDVNIDITHNEQKNRCLTFGALKRKLLNIRH